MKVVVIGGSTQDIFLEIDGTHLLKAAQELGVKNYFSFEEGAKIEVKNLSYHSGGGGTNSAVAFKRLGFQVTCFSLVGNDGAGERGVQVAHLVEVIELVEVPAFERGNDDVGNPSSEKEKRHAHGQEPAGQHQESNLFFHSLVRARVS